MVILIQNSQGISSTTVENIKTVVKRMLSKLTSVSTDTKVALATYATSRRISCFGTTAQTISYMDNEYQHAGSGLNLLNLALSKMVLKQFDKRPDDRKTRDTSKVSFSLDYFPFGCKLSKFKLSLTLIKKMHMEDLGKKSYKHQASVILKRKQKHTARLKAESLLFTMSILFFILIQQIVCNIDSSHILRRERAE